MQLRATSLMRSQRLEPAIPLREYFLSVGGALLALLVVADWLLPHPAPNPIMNHPFDHPAVRIHSDVKRPEAVVIDGAAAGLAMLAELDHSTAAQGPPAPASETGSAPVKPPPFAAPTEQEDSASPVMDSYAQLVPDLAPNPISKSNPAAIKLRKRLPTASRHMVSNVGTPRTEP